MVSQPPGELMDNFFKDHRIHILTQHVKEEPVAHLGLFDDNVNALFPDQPEPDVEQVGPHPGWKDDD